MISAFTNCLKIPELRKKIFFTLGIIALCRVAANVPCPGIDPEALQEAGVLPFLESDVIRVEQPADHS